MQILRTLLASLILVAFGVAALAAATDRFQAFTSETARRVAIRQHPLQVPDVELQTQSGTHINMAGLRGKWVAVDFIYTRCMTFCSVLDAEYARLQELLARPLAENKLRLLSISFDPAHDTPVELTNYLDRFDGHAGDWLVTRPVNAVGLRQLERVFGVTVIPDGHGGYVHNAAIEVVDPQGRLFRILDIGNPVAASRLVLQEMK